jgi:hypothetical protein
LLGFPGPVWAPASIKANPDFRPELRQPDCRDRPLVSIRARSSPRDAPEQTRFAAPAASAS